VPEPAPANQEPNTERESAPLEAIQALLQSGRENATGVPLSKLVPQQQQLSAKGSRPGRPSGSDAWCCKRGQRCSLPKGSSSAQSP
jgi:hypothetical protein